LYQWYATVASPSGVALTFTFVFVTTGQWVCMSCWSGVECGVFGWQKNGLDVAFRIWSFFAAGILSILTFWRLYLVYRHRRYRRRHLQNTSIVWRWSLIYRSLIRYCQRMFHPQYSNQFTVLLIYIASPLTSLVNAIDPYGGEGLFDPQTAWGLQWFATVGGSWATALAISHFVWVQSNARHRPSIGTFLKVSLLCLCIANPNLMHSLSERNSGHIDGHFSATSSVW
jgi:hypothetical protein